ncbi:hypothetical protein HID58_074714, partial [Brassica napus]
MSSSRNTSGSQRRGRQSSGEARTTTDGGTTREGQDKNCQVMLELVIAELKADDYRTKLVNCVNFGIFTVNCDRIAVILYYVDGITMVDQLQETQTAEPIVDLTSDQGCNRSIRSMSSRRLARRKT